jgi:nitrate reductase alpha subunit
VAHPDRAQHFFLDHDWMTEMGEQLPTFRPPLNMHRLFGDQGIGGQWAKRSPCAT